MVASFTARTGYGQSKHTFFKRIAQAGVAAALTLGMSTMAFSQSADDASAEQYAALLQQIADMKVQIAHKEVHLAHQQARIEALESQIETVQGTIDTIGPMMDKMSASISDEIELDLPFNAAERFDRLAGLEEVLADQEARPIDKFRRALMIYEAEVSYGQSVQSYPGDHPDASKAGSRLAACEADIDSRACALNKAQKDKMEEDDLSVSDMEDQLMDGDYLRFGRLSLAFMMADGSEVLRYDADSKSWVEMSGTRALDVRRAIKQAKGEAAPAVVEAPVVVN